MVDEYSRRDMIKASGAGIAAALAGCAGNETEPNNTPETTTTDSGYQVTGYEVEDNLEELENGENIEVTAKRVLENGDGERKTEDLETSDYEIIGETIRYHEQVEDSILKEAGLYKDLQDTVEQNDGSYSFSANDLIAGKNLLTLEIQINDTEYGNTETYENNGELQVSKSQEETLKDVLVEDHEIYDHLRDQFRPERIGTSSRGQKFQEIPENISQEISRSDYDSTEDWYQNIAEIWIEEAAEIVGNAPSNEAHRLADTLEHINEDTIATALVNRGHNTVLAINEKENKVYHVETGALGRTDTPPEDGYFPRRYPEETPLMSPKHRLGMAKNTLRGLTRVQSPSGINRRHVNDIIKIEEELAVAFMNNMREDTKTEEILDFAKTAGATMELSPSLDYELSGTFEDEPEISVES